MTETNPAPTDHELSMPWYVTGKLAAAEAAEIATALESSDALQRLLLFAEDEQSETIALNESLAAPSRAAYDALFARIEAAEAQRRVPRGASRNALDWLAGKLASLSPRALALSATAAGLAICVQAGLLTSLVVKEPGTTRYTTASAPSAAATGTFVLISFAPNATTEAVTRFLEAHKATIADGPKPGGLYRVKVADTKLSLDAVTEIVTSLRSEGAVVRLALPEPATP